MTQAIDARVDPAGAQALLDRALAEQPKPAQPSTPEIGNAPDTSVTLSAGWYDPSGMLHTTAEVRELTGTDEEALAKVGNNSRLLATILSRGVVSIGGATATSAMLDDLLLGDADALLLGIRIATFGADLELEVLCPKCTTLQSRVIDLRTDMPSTPLEGMRDFDVDLKVGQAKVFLPTHRTQKKLMAIADKTAAEMNTLLLTECVHLIGGASVDVHKIRRLGMADRQKLLAELSTRLIGPRLEEVKLPCESCDESIELPLAMADLFRL